MGGKSPHIHPTPRPAVRLFLYTAETWAYYNHIHFSIGVICVTPGTLFMVNALKQYNHS